jgi:hypothetical protein
MAVLYEKLHHSGVAIAADVDASGCSWD